MFRGVHGVGSRSASCDSNTSDSGFSLERWIERNNEHNLRCQQLRDRSDLWKPWIADCRNGATLAQQNVSLPYYPYGVAVNSVTNKIYVASCGTDPSCSSAGQLSVIDGATLNVQQVTVGINPDWVAVDATTNKIYVSNLGCQSLPCTVAWTGVRR